MNEALRFFNQARKDSEWGEKALFAMVEICINPENEILGAETLKPVDGPSARYYNACCLTCSICM